MRMQLSTRIRRRGLKDLVLWLQGPGQLRGWWWGVFHLKGHNDAPLVTLQFHHRGIRCQSCLRSVIEYTRDPKGWQPELAISAASLVISTKTEWAKELLRNLLVPAWVYVHVLGKAVVGSKVVTCAALLVLNTVACNGWDTSIVLQVPRDSVNLAEKA